jgi:hypothetical protein
LQKKLDPLVVQSIYDLSVRRHDGITLKGNRGSFGMAWQDVVDVSHDETNAAPSLGEPVIQNAFRRQSVGWHEQSGMAGDYDSVTYCHGAYGKWGE